MHTLIATLISLMLFVTTAVVVGDWIDAHAAYKAGDYQKALLLWETVAEQGNKFAQSILGMERTE